MAHISKGDLHENFNQELELLRSEVPRSHLLCSCSLPFCHCFLSTLPVYPLDSSSTLHWLNLPRPPL